jgi:ATPase (PilT family)
MKDTVVPDTSIIIDGELSRHLENNSEDVFIPEFVVDELENQANSGRETGYKGIEEIKKVRELSEERGFSLEFGARRPTQDEIELANSGRIDALIRDVAEEEDARLFTADRVQAEIAEAKGIEYRFFETEDETEFELEDFFDDQTMSVHLKQGDVPKAKRGRPGEFELEEIGEDELGADDLDRIISGTSGGGRGLGGRTRGDGKRRCNSASDR